ncbi:MAG: excinuclease ABC subunit UvrC [Candidatus Marinimicrobia bacterium]|nr:excinuclease ABC subunit UvrC [Candidatus Neomarinimicrobiota bacterium]MDP6936150.1 excinuclease ABC subunit UvrC [Candidatus Neomarinimicrobiota bacterium]
MKELKQKLSQVPKSPGVYFFHDIEGNIIYIGKAKILRNRVRSYFTKPESKDAKTQVLVKQIANFEWMVVRSEVEALLTEANLIKEHKPRYNVFLKDDKTFPYIRITNEPYPRVEIIRQKNLSKDDHNYFGPFTDAGYLREILRVLHKIFPLRTCTYFIDENTIKEGKIKVCLDYHIKRCEGPCEGLVSEENYSKMILQIIQFLKGRNKDIQQHLMQEMEKASTDLQFEDAAHYRDQLHAVTQFMKKQKKISQDFMDRDVITVSSENRLGIGLVMRIRNGHMMGREKFILKLHDAEADTKKIEQFLLQYYASTMDYPKEVLLEIPPADTLNIETWLSKSGKKKVKLLVPQKGEKRKLVEISKRNADLLLGELKLKQAKRKELLNKPVLQLQEDLGMEVPPRRIEAFDNSNIHGSNPVAGMVCFVDGKPKKSEYRKFHIKSVIGIDDFASMREVVHRRYSRQLKEKNPLPDLILIDGGKGQLSAAKSALDALGLGYLSVIGLAKRLEEVFKPGMKAAQNISKTSAGLHLLRAIRDEVHRFAISFHRSTREKEMTKSIFSGIKGMGAKRTQKLWKSFKSIEEMKSADIQGIRDKTGFPLNLCEKILAEVKEG